MRVLLLEDNIPKKAGSGGHVATHGLIAFLRERSDVHIINVVSNPTLDSLDGLGVTVFHRREGGGVASKVRSIVSSQPKMVTEIDVDALERLIKSLDAFDRIVYGSARFLCLSSVSDAWYVADNVEWELALDMQSNYRSPKLAELDAGRIRRLEAMGISKAKGVCAFTDRDANRLRALAGRDIEVIPPILPPSARPLRPRERFAFYPTNLDHPPNADAMEWLLGEVWPLKGSDWKLVVTGAGDFSDLAARHPDIDFRGFVSREELGDLYDRAGVVINPTRTGSGFQIKLLEALAYGCPVVSTDFSNPLGSAIRSSDDPGRFAALVDEVLAAATIEPFDYEAFYRDACSKMEEFLGLSRR